MKIRRAKAKELLAAKNQAIRLAAALFLLVIAAISLLVSTQDLKPFLLLVDESAPAIPVRAVTSDSKVPSQHPPLHCPTLLEDVLQNRSSIQDPNKGQVFSRWTDLPPSFQIALHTRDFDPPRWSIMEWGHYYETALMNAFSVVLNETKRSPDNMPRVVDVGGNIGFFSLLAAAHGKVIVDTFEPNLANAFRMCQSVQLNGWVNEFDSSATISHKSSRVNCHAYGVGKELGSLFLAESWNPGQGKLSDTAKKGKEIPVITLDAFAESRGWFDSRPDIAILKVDVEGYEINVFQGGRRLLNSGMIRNIFMEVSARNQEEIRESSACLGLIASAGYDVYQYGGFRGPKHIVNWSGQNVTQLTDLVIHEVTKKKHPQLNLWFKLR